MKLLVTGGAGFIGSAFIQYVLQTQAQVHIVNVDKLTYAANHAWLCELEHEPRHQLERVDVSDAPALERVFARHQPDVVLHLAAESHVDRSIEGPAAFVQTNLVGTHVLLETVRHYWMQLPLARKAAFRLHHVSTDEVYGDLMDAGTPEPVREGAAYAPSSPYSASKAGADHLVLAWHRTYGLPVVLSHACNNYGPRQYPEKLIPVMIQQALQGLKLPVYGAGTQVRDWLHVDDHACALWAILQRGQIGRSYHVSAGHRLENIALVRQLCALLDELHPQGRPLGLGGRPESYASLIRHTPDRPGHDRYYALDASRLMAELAWVAQHSFEQGLRDTVKWYLANP
ncbi:dTDP-glucose 4,6-dehydratase [Pusillimonas sp. CC-YST705]|uniref:dTDP-glucose 4,6-dehydratase n=1 Tax=Mesopusillimonas faecipullorum TaxID=2755040 RepID=A0ABS8CDJ3_9BURK|nr:dTDP-glucose 4,6-dehydratase [Mesopusillimonas faecipullorum]MCB5364117.1 dTDP-glucose 4,6-dehydratase [Mesopusillimonas faecipullorum]